MERIRRVVAAGAALSIIGVAVAAFPAGAASSGYGTTVTRTTVLDVQVGQAGGVLHLALLSDVGSASTDSHQVPASASTSITALSATSSLLHLRAVSPTVATHAPGTPSDLAGQSLSLASLGVPAVVATAGVTVGALHSDYASGAAHSSMSAATVDHLSLVGGGLLSVDHVGSTLGAEAVPTGADGARGVDVGTVKVLDLGTLLKGLGVDPSSLSVAALSNLLTAAGVPVGTLPVGTDMATYVGQLNAAVTAVQDTVNPTLGKVTATVDGTVKGILGSAGVPVPTTSSTVGQVQSVIAQLRAKIVAVLTDGLGALDAAPLVRIAPTSIGLSTRAADTLGHSSAAVNAAPLQVTVAGVALPLIDATTATGAVGTALTTANAALGRVVGAIGLPADLVTVSMLDKASSVSMNGAYTQAVAGLTALTARVAPIDPAAVSAAVAKLAGPSVGSVLGGALASVPLPASAAMGALNSALGTVAPLTGGAVVRIASVAGASTYVTAAAATRGATGSPRPTSLPRTGGNHLGLILLGGMFLVLSVAVTRWLRIPTTFSQG